MEDVYALINIDLIGLNKNKNVTYKKIFFYILYSYKYVLQYMTVLLPFNLIS